MGAGPLRLEAFIARLPRAVRRPFRRLACLPLDAAERILGLRDPLTPPRGLSDVGLGDFRAVGRAFLESFQEIGGLSPSDRVLDIGCGVGRMAVPLIGYLDGPGTYEGFDVVRSEIRWCRRAISSRNPRFCFLHADCANTEYNPRGKIPAAEFRFPWMDASFDFAFATSVFTHLLPDAAANYFSEIARTLVPGGRVFFTVFLLNAASRAEIERGRTSYAFPHEVHGAFVRDAGSPEAAVAWDEEVLMAMLESTGLRLLAAPYRGFWAGGPGPTYQDVIVAARR